MNPEEQRVAIAEACGWKFTRDTDGEYHYYNKLGDHVSSSFHGYPPTMLPDYLNDLNAMHEAEEVCIRSLEADARYCHTLELIARKQDEHYTPTRAMVSATAAQRAEAFLRTISKWTDDKGGTNA